LLPLVWNYGSRRRFGLDCGADYVGAKAAAQA